MRLLCNHLRVIGAFLAFCWCFTGEPGVCQNLQVDDYANVEKHLDRLEQQGQYQEAIAFLDSVEEQYPRMEFDMSKRLASYFLKTGQYEKSLETWEAGHRKQYFYGIFAHLPMYEPFKHSARFRDIAGTDDQLRQKAIAESQLQYKVVLPEAYNEHQHYPLLIILHGGGSTIEQAGEHWNSEKLNGEFIRLFIQSYLYVDMHTFSWGIKDPRARKDIRECYHSIIHQYPIDINNVIIGGISAGGYTAMDVAIHEVIGTTGFMAVCPETEPEDYDNAGIQRVSKKGLKGFIISGAQDPYITQQKEIATLFKRSGMDIQMEVIQEMGHEYPADFEGRIDSSLAYLLQDFPVLEGAYLGQNKAGKIPEIFAPGVVSTSGKEFAGTFSPDGTEYYFTRSGGEGRLPTNTIMLTRKINGMWSKPAIASFSGQYFDFEPHITPDGQRLYFGSRRPVHEQEDPTVMRQWYLEKDSSGWSSPIPVDSPLTDLPAMYISSAKNGNLYFSVDNPEAGIWVSKFVKGSYQKPEKLPGNVNDLKAVLHPFIAPDESYLIFDAQPEVPGIGPDLFISYRDPDGTWTKAINMGDEINKSREMCPSVSPDGKYFFFSRDGDIYWVDARVLHHFLK